jgi:predicted nucleic acid-binding protein
VISVGELEAGVLLAPDGATRALRLRLLSAVLAEAPVVDVDRAVSARYGELRAASGRRPTNASGSPQPRSPTISRSSRATNAKRLCHLSE